MKAEARAVAEPALAPSPFANALDALQSRDFRLLWLNGFSFFLARGMAMLSTGWLVKELTDSPSLVGAVFFVQGAPIFLFSLLAGVWADRLDRRGLIIASQAAAIAVTAVLAVVALAGVVATWQVFVLSFAMGTAMALGQPSRQALIPALVAPERLMNAVVLNTLILNLSFVIGPALAGALIAGLDFGGAFLVQVAVLLAGFPLLLAMRSPAVERAAAPAAVVSELREGLAFVGSDALIRALFVLTGVTGVFFIGSYQALLPVFADDVLDVGSTGYGLLSGAMGLGMLGGSLFIASRGDFARKGEALLSSLAIGGLVFVTFAASSWYPLSLLTMLAWGFGAAFFMNLTITIVQSHTPDRLMGRVMSAQQLSLHGLSPLGALAAGGFAEAAGAPAAAVVGGLAVVAVALVFFAREPALRAMR